MEYRLLGPLEVLRDGRPLALGGSKQRTALALLVLNAGEVVSTDSLVDTLWGEEPPQTALTALQGHVSRLRKLLGAEQLLTQPPGYRLSVDPETVDLIRFERLCERARREEPAAGATTLRQALELWRGPALADLRGREHLAGESGRLDEARRAAHEDLIDYELVLGRHAALIAELESLVAAEPFRERSAAQLMLALYRSGRPADALQAYRGYRGRLVDELGLEPGRALRELEQQILRQDPGLAPPVPRDGPAEPDRRTRVSVVAAALSVETAAGGQPDAEVYSSVVTRWREAVRLALERHGGSLQSVRGSALLAAFGLPALREDDALRAVGAAEAARAATAAVDGEVGAYFGVRVRARIGVAGGEMYAGESVALDRASRLQEAAGPGETLIDEEAYRAVADAVTVEPADDGALRLTRVAQAATIGDRRPARRLVGRRREQRRLRRGFRALAAGGGPRLTVLVGPAGIGKSKLVDDLLDSVGDEATVLRTRCLPYGDGIGLLPAVELVRGLAGLPAGAREVVVRERLERLLRGDERAPAVVVRLLELLGLSDEPSEPEELSWAVNRLLEVVARRRPVVIAVDDLHWADAALLDLLEHVLDPARTAPVFVLATARTPPRERFGGPDSIVLEPLADDACAELVAAILGEPGIAPDALAELVDASGGNPLFLEELVRTLRANGRLRPLDGCWRLSEPATLHTLPTIQALLAARLEQLAPRERDFVARASIVGRTFGAAAVGALAAENVDGSLAVLVDADIVRPSAGEPGVFEFRHLLIRDAAYETLPLELRAGLHERHADRIEQTSEPLAVYHLDQAYRARLAFAPGDPMLPGQAASLARRLAALGRRSLARGDAAAAAQLLGRARELGAGDVLADLGRALLEAGDFPAADEAFAAAAGPEAIRGRLGRLEVRLRTDPDCDLDAAALEVDGALAALGSSDDEAGRAEAWLARAYLGLVRCRSAELTSALERALPHARSAGMGRVESWIRFLECAACWYGPFPVADGIRRCREIRAEARERPAVEAAALQALAVLEAMAGRFAAGRRLVESSRSIRAELGQEVGVAATAIDAGIVELLSGCHADAERVLRRGYDDLERLGEKGYFSTVASLLADAVEAQGRIDEAAEIARASAAAAVADDVASQVGWRTTEARCLARRGRTAEAEQTAREATSLADGTDFLLLRGQAWAACADVLAGAGRSEEAADARATAVAQLELKGFAPRAIAAWARAGRRGT